MCVLSLLCVIMYVLSGLNDFVCGEYFVSVICLVCGSCVVCVLCVVWFVCDVSVVC